jgi:polyisoprenoid-binding protein YceI
MPELMTDSGLVRVPAGTWKVDPSHSSVGFEVKHMMIATVRGRFEEFDGMLEADEDISQSRAYGWANAASINTGDATRDEHLRSPEFFDVERYPRITYESTRIEPAGGQKFRITGNLTIKDVTHEIDMDATVHGAGEDPWGNARVGVSVEGVINRNDFGLTWQQRLARGGVLVGEEVKIVLDVSAVRA